MNDPETKKRINKGIIFLRGFSNLENTLLYKKAVLRFIDLVEVFVNGENKKNLFDEAKEIFSK